MKTHLDLFSGIGGFALAARWAGFETIGFCEIDKYAQKVLKKNFPGVPIYEDVTKLNGNQFKDIYLLTGGFPCQDISIAGKGAGLDGERSGLWTELHRIISQIRPKYALIENVPALTFRGGARVIGDLTEIGYDCEWQIVGADDVGAPHRRKRIWIVAYPKHRTDRTNGRKEREEEGIQGVNWETGLPRLSGGTGSNTGDVAYSQSIGNRRKARNIPEQNGTQRESGETSVQPKPISNGQDVAYSKCNSEGSSHRSNIGIGGRRWDEQSVVEWNEMGGNSGNSSEDVAYSNSKRGRLWEANREDAEDVRESSRCEKHGEGITRSSIRGMAYGVPKGFHKDIMWQKEPEDINRVSVGVKDRVQRLKGLGNSICPQVAYEIMKCLK